MRPVAATTPILDVGPVAGGPSRDRALLPALRARAPFQGEVPFSQGSHAACTRIGASVHTPLCPTSYQLPGAGSGHPRGSVPRRGWTSDYAPRAPRGCEVSHAGSQHRPGRPVLPGVPALARGPDLGV